METTFLSCPESEIEKVIHTAAVTASGFYSRNGFVVLPKVEGSCREASIILPDLDYRAFPYFWQRVMVIPPQFPMVVPRDVQTDMAKLVKHKLVGISERELSKWSQRWVQAEDAFWSAISLFFPDEICYVGSLEIRVTQYGSPGSFSFLGTRRKQKLIVYVRSDMDISQIAEAIVTAILYPDREIRGFTWSKREAIVDFFMTRREMLAIFSMFKPTLTGVSRVPPSLREKSEVYLRKLGVIYGKRQIDIVSGTLYVLDRNVEHEFGAFEKKVLTLMVERQGELVTFDEIEDVMWGVGGMKSLWAITKMMQRIRGKLVTIGVHKSILRTLRGRGYLLES